MTLRFHRVPLFALPLVIAALAAPAASATEFPTARQIATHEGTLGTPSTAAEVSFPTARQVALHEGTLSATSTPSNAGRVASNPGIDWGDAGIGAGAALVLVSVVLYGAFVLTNRRRGEVGRASTV